MNTVKDIKKLWQYRDRVVRAMSVSGNFRASAIVNTNATKMAQENHKLDPAAALLLARCLSAAAILASFLKGEERVVVEALGNGIYKKVFAEALQVGEIRGYVDQNPQPAILDDALGAGLLRVTRVLYGKYEPIVGIVALEKGNITTDLAFYLTQSEQIPSAVRLDVAFDQNGIIQHSAGLVVQALPGAPEAEIITLQNSIRELGSIAELASNGYTPDEILQQAIPFDIEIITSSPIDFFCRCSLDKYKSILVTLGEKEIKDMIESKNNELICQYCNKHYYLTDDDFNEMFIQLEALKN